MSSPAHISAVTVNHNTSHFTELMVRTLLLTHDLSRLGFTITVLDNSSGDEHLAALTAYLATHRIPLIQTGFDSSVAVEKHGLALQSFVLHHADCTHYLFLDADMWFVEPDTVSTMLKDLDGADAAVWANQARIAGYYAGRIIEGHDEAPGAGNPQTWPIEYERDSFVATQSPRCSPVCCLIKNTPVFRRVVELIGVAPAVRFQLGTATYFDTLALLTQVMMTHDQRFMVSSATINHFTEVAHQPDRRAPKDHDCLRMLRELRAGRGMTLDIFYESDWVRQQRLL